MTTYTETAFTFDCSGQGLAAILAMPGKPAKQGVLVIVGGPQYRAGSHRQFTLLSRDLADSGIPCMRFDYRGMGDSEGSLHMFEEVEEDIRAAVDAFFAHCPGLERVVLWGLCDAASAVIFYAHRDPRVNGLVLANPWVRTQQGKAKAQLKHYYLSRLTNPDMWRKLISGKFDFADSFKSFFGSVSKAKQKGPESAQALPERMRTSLERFPGKVLLIMSGNDLVAREFEDAVESSNAWQSLLDTPRFVRKDLPDADHTFSSRTWHNQVAEWTRDWAKRL
jgi:uncharacterized protein